jgi:general secretion pathway protein J
MTSTCPATRIAARREEQMREATITGLPCRSRGFTLVEALVAVAILGLVALLAWRATAAMTDGEARLASESTRWQQLDAVLTRIEADLRESVPRRGRHGAGVEAAWSLLPEDAAGNALVVFTRAGPDATDEPGSAGQRIGYRWRNGAIEALYWPQIDNSASVEPAAFALIDGVLRFRMVALAGAAESSDRWPVPGASDIPRGVRVELTLVDGGTIERWLALQ